LFIESDCFDMAMKEKPCILFLITEDWYFWSHRLAIARAARDMGFKVLVATRVDQHKSLIEKEGFQLIPLRMKRRSYNVINELLSLIEIVRIYRKEKPDIVHHVAVKPVLYGALAARITGISGVVHALAGLGFIFTEQGWKVALLRGIFIHAYRFAFSGKNTIGIFQNPEDLKSFVDFNIVPRNRAVLIRGAGVDVSFFKYLPESTGIPTVLLASRMLWSKGVGEFVNAARQLKADGVKCRAILVGIPDMENPSAIPEERLREWHAEGSVEWGGKREDMPKVLSGAHIVVLPTTYGEGVPKILIEAASCGRAVIATNVPGCREIVRHHVNGLLIPPHDLSALVGAIKNLIIDTKLRGEMGIRGRTIAESEFSEEIVVKKTLDVYKMLIHRKDS